MSDLLAWLEAECFDLRCESTSVGYDDADIIWVVYSHHMAEPRLRPEGFGRTAIEAIRDAMLPKDDPDRWGADDGYEEMPTEPKGDAQ